MHRAIVCSRIALAQYGYTSYSAPELHAQRKWIGDFCRQQRATDLYFNQEYQWNEQRDHQLAASLSGVHVQSFADRVSCSQALYSPEMAATIQCLAR